MLPKDGGGERHGLAGGHTSVSRSGVVILNMSSQSLSYINFSMMNLRTGMRGVRQATDIYSVARGKSPIQHPANVHDREAIVLSSPADEFIFRLGS